MIALACARYLCRKTEADGERNSREARTLYNVQRAPGLAFGVLVRVDAGIALDVDQAALGQGAEEVAAGSFGLEAGDAEPAGGAVVAAAAVASDGVAKDLAACAGGDELRRVSQVADDGDLGDVAARRGAEGAGSGPSGADGGAKQGRHGDGIDQSNLDGCVDESALLGEGYGSRGIRWSCSSRVGTRSNLDR